MIAWKFLRAGAVAPFSGFRWTRGAWVAGQRGVAACRLADLPHWLDDELWTIELDGLLREGEAQIAAERGRLIARVDAWTEAAAAEFAQVCAQRVRQLAGAAPPDRADNLAAYARGAASSGVERNWAEAGFIAAAAAAYAAKDEAAYASERLWQAQWLADRLGLRG